MSFPLVSLDILGSSIFWNIFSNTDAHAIGHYFWVSFLGTGVILADFQLSGIFLVVRQLLNRFAIGAQRESAHSFSTTGDKLSGPLALFTFTVRSCLSTATVSNPSGEVVLANTGRMAV